MLRLRLTSVASLCFGLFLFSSLVSATNIGADPAACLGGNSVCSQHLQSYSFVSLTEGNVAETYTGPRVVSEFGPTLTFNLIYNSYNADGTRTSLDDGLGFGWTHTYDDFVFTQGNSIFRWSGDGRITKFSLSNGTYESAPGYFEKLVFGTAGSVTITDKYQTRYYYLPMARPTQDSLTPDTLSGLSGNVLRLVSITDRNQNVTTLSYSAGFLMSVSDTYGRALSFTYNSKNHLASVTDPIGRVTSFTYDVNGQKLMSITDPLGKVTRYSYNGLNQIVSKVDRDQRTFTISYQNSLPYSETDSNGGTVYALTNTSNWATDPNQLQQNYLRVYIPSTTSRVDGRGNTWQYSYDGNGFPLTITAPDGAVTTYTYDPATLRVLSMTDCNGHTTLYAYDSKGNTIQTTDANGNVTSYTYEPVFNQMTSMTDPNGRVTTYSYDSHGNRLSETDPLEQTASWTYDSHGNVLSATDKRGNITTYIYDASGNRIQASDPLGEVTHYTYDGAGNRISVTDPNAHTTQYLYNALNRLVSMADPNGNTEQVVYDGEGDRTSLADENGHTTSYAYDLRLRLVTMTDALGKPTTYTYDGNNNKLSMTDRNMHTTTYTYDVHNRLVTITDPLGNTSTRSYDCAGNVLSETDANGHTSSYLYDALDRPVQRTDSLNEITTLGYDLTGLPGHPECTGPTTGSGKVTKLVDPNGKVVYFAFDGRDRKIIDIHKQGGTTYNITSNDAVTYTTYDANSNRIAVSEPDGDTTTYSYDVVNRQVQTVNAAGDTTTMEYDAASNLTSVTYPNLDAMSSTYDSLNRLTGQSDSAGQLVAYSYDPGGNIRSQADGNGNLTTYTYDNDDRLLTTKDALCLSHARCKPIVYTYDPGGNKLTESDRNGNVTTYGYDPDDRPTQVTNPLGNVTQTQYDAVGNVTERIDGNGHATTYGYDAQNRETSETFADPDHNTLFYAYDAAGKLISRTDQNSQTTTYAYSDLYFMISRSYPNSGTDNFTYDLSGRMLSASHGGWTDTFAYDGANRVTQTGQNGQTIAYAYNIPGRTRTVTYPSGRAITEQMDARNRRSTINDGGSTPIVQYSYDAASNVLARGLRNGTNAASAYNQNNWVTSLNDTQGSTRFLGFQYAYDNEGNKQYENKLHDPGHSEGYTSDTIYELTDFKVGMLVGGTIPNPVTETTYNLDAVHNWNSKDTDGVIQSRTHTASNEISAIDGNPYVSDYNGNLTNDGSSIYFYDEENRLLMVTDEGTGHTIQQNQYDAFGRRVSTIDTFGTQTFYYYDGQRSIEEQSSVGLTQATYVFGNELDEVLSMDRGGQSFYYHTNQLGSIVALTDPTGLPIEAYQYDSYGYQTIILPGPNGIIDYGGDDIYEPGGESFYGNPFLFNAQRYDPGPGLLYYKNRYYSTFLGRFLTRDPMGMWADPVELGNAYSYVGNNPENSIDPMGFGATNGVGGVGLGLGKKTPDPPPPPPAPPTPIIPWDFGPKYFVLPTGPQSPTGPHPPTGTGPTYPGNPFPPGTLLFTADPTDIVYDKPMGDQQEDFSITKLIDAASPKLLMAAARKAGKDQQEYMKITLSDCLVATYHTSGSGGSDVNGGNTWATAAVDYFLKIDGFLDESQDDKHKNEFELDSWSYGASQAGNFTSGELSVWVDKAGPKLLHAFDWIDLSTSGQVTQAGPATYNVAQRPAPITAPSPGGPSMGKNQKPDGTLGGTTKMQFNLKTMKATA